MAVINEKASELIRLLNEDDRFKLLPIMGVAVHTPTIEEFSDLKKVYEVGGWRWLSGKRATKYDSWWEDDKKETCVDAGAVADLYSLKLINDTNLNHFRSGSKSWYKNNGYMIIPTDKFYEIQKISFNSQRDINKGIELLTKSKP